jgi:hypothetical protein
MKTFFLFASVFLLPSLSQAQTSTYENTVQPRANRIFYVSQYAGADIGEKINAADPIAGAGPADIWVTAEGSVSTVPTIRRNHRLILAAPLIWTVAPVLKSDTQIIGNGSIATQTVTAPGAWIVASNLSNVEIDDLWVANANIPTAEGSQILAVLLAPMSL